MRAFLLLLIPFYLSVNAQVKEINFLGKKWYLHGYGFRIKLLISFIGILLIASCTDKAKETHADQYSSHISFTVSNSAYIESYSVYLNENLVRQISSDGRGTLSKYTFESDDITQHPATLNYTIKPLFHDSANALTDIALFLVADEERVAETPAQTIKYNETASLSHTVE